MADSDVDDILQKFFVTIAEKDSDALKLFEDNKRMRDLVEQTLRARDELETRHRATVLLVDSLQTTLREKDELIAAHDSESAEWREQIAELRALLDRPSELDHGLEDVVEDVRGLLAELRSLRHAFQYAQWCCDGWEAYTAEAVLQAETQERMMLTNAAAVQLNSLHTCAEEVCHVLRSGEERSSALRTTIAEWEAWHARVEDERAALVEEHDDALQEAKTQVEQAQAQIEALRRHLDKANADANGQAQQHQRQQLLHCLEQEHSTHLVQLLVERCRGAESRWAATVQELRGVVHALATAQRERDELTAKHELVLLTQDHNRQRVLKLTKQVEQLQQRQSDYDAAQQRCAELKEEVQVLREKYLTATEKERKMRQQLHSSTETAAAKLSAAEEASATNQRHRFALEERLRTAQEELKALQKETTVLRRQAEEHRATQALLQATETQLRETERHAFNFDAALEKVKLEQQSELQAAEARHAEAVAQLREAHDAAQAQAAQSTQAKLEEMERALQHARAAHAEEKAQLQHELGEWIQEVENQKKLVSAQQSRLEAERSARQLLEQQHRQETSVVRTMLVEQSREEAERGPRLTELTLQLSAATQRRDLLEEACRRSAGVIAQLREALHREQITSRTLRQRDASLSP